MLRVEQGEKVIFSYLQNRCVVEGLEATFGCGTRWLITSSGALRLHRPAWVDETPDLPIGIAEELFHRWRAL